MADLKHFRLLGGMIHCGCGQTMTTQKVCNNKRTRKHYTYYFCMGRREGRNDCREPRIRLEIVERLAWEKVVALVRDPATLRKAIEQARGSENQAQLELERQRSALQEAEQKIVRLIELLGDAT